MKIPHLIFFAATSVVGNAALVWTVGMEDNDQPTGLTGGGANTAFVQENATINPLPGSPTSTAVAQGADNDYYFAGTYTSTIPSVVAFYGAYAPIGVVASNELAAERAHAAGDLDLRYHFNLPAAMAGNQPLTITWNATSLDDLNATNTNPRFGNELYFNGILVQPQIIVLRSDIHDPPAPFPPNPLGTTYTTAPFTLASVNGVVGPGADNIVSLKGISYNGAGGGNWMGLDYIRLDAVPEPASAIMILCGAIGLAPFLRRRRA
jgi:hypothetical protein